MGALRRWIAMMLWLPCAVAGAGPLAGSSAVPQADKAALAQAVKAMCGKQVVLLGEASHGDGHGDLAKAALVQALVARCGFTGVLFEASVYEFIPVARDARHGQTVEPQHIARAVGGLWNRDVEVQPMFRFLANRVQAGRLQVGGLDFQAGGMGQPYSNEGMMAELAQLLPVEQGEHCQAQFQSHLMDTTPPNGLSEAQRSQALQGCMRDIGATLQASATTQPEHAERLIGWRNLQAWLALDGQPTGELGRVRDPWMARNAEAFIGNLPKRAKVVIWTHNWHASRSVRALGGQEGSETLGEILGQRLGHRLYSLAVAARTGEFRWSGNSHRAIPAPPPEALEALPSAPGPGPSTFITKPELQRAGIRPAGVLGHNFVTARWSDAYDGILVLNTEFPPHRIED